MLVLESRSRQATANTQGFAVEFADVLEGSRKLHDSLQLILSP